MSRHLSLLKSIFQEPISANVHWREIESLLYHLGATIKPIHGARFRMVLNEVEFILHHPHQGNELTRITSNNYGITSPRRVSALQAMKPSDFGWH